MSVINNENTIPCGWHNSRHRHLVELGAIIPQNLLRETTYYSRNAINGHYGNYNVVGAHFMTSFIIVLTSSGENICKPKPSSRMAEEWIISRRWLPCIRRSTERWSVSYRHNTILCRAQTVHNIHIKNGGDTVIKPPI